MGMSVFTLCMRTGKKHTNPQWTPAVIECDSFCILSIAPGSWQLIGIYSSLNRQWTPQRGSVVRRRWPAVGLAVLRWRGTLIPLTLKMRARMGGKLEAPKESDRTVQLCLYVCARLYSCVCDWLQVHVSAATHFNGVWIENVGEASVAVYYGWRQEDWQSFLLQLSLCR